MRISRLSGQSELGGEMHNDVYMTSRTTCSRQTLPTCVIPLQSRIFPSPNHLSRLCLRVSFESAGNPT